MNISKLPVATLPDIITDEITTGRVTTNLQNVSDMLKKKKKEKEGKKGKERVEVHCILALQIIFRCMVRSI